MDARTVMSSYAQGLKFLCETSQQIINTEIDNTLSAFLVSPQALTNSSLDRIAMAPLRSLVGIASQRLSSASNLFTYTVSADMAVSALGTNAGIYFSSQTSVKPSLIINVYKTLGGSLCYCLPTQTCVTPAAVYSSVPSTTSHVFSMDANSTFVTGMRTDCYPYDGLLASTLECYHDEPCLRLLVSNSSIFKVLDSTLPSRFQASSTVNQLVAVAMTEDFSYDYSAEYYFTRCAPRSCTYSYEHGSTALDMIVMIIGVIGGLNTGLRLMIPFLIRFLIKCWRKYRPSATTKPAIAITMTRSGTAVALQQKIVRLVRKIMSVNLFDSNSNNAVTINRERKMTYLYVVLLVIAATILICYANLFQTARINTVKNPSQNDYLALQAKYPAVLECLCSNNEIHYGTIMQMNITYHQICSSRFVSPLFIAQFATFDTTATHQYDFMTMSGVYFIHVALLCKLVTQYVPQAYEIYRAENFVTSKLMTPDQFEKQLNDGVVSQIAVIKTYLYHTLLDVVELSSKSYGMSALYTYFNIEINSTGSIYTAPSHFFNCSCITNPDRCSTDAAFYTYTSSNDTLALQFKIDGLRLACSPMRSTLLSSFACWYSSECYEQVKNGVRL